MVSNAERRALGNGESLAVPRVVDVYAALPAITGKIELEYEGELKGGDTVGRELIRRAVGKTFDRYFEGVNMQPVVQWFDLGGSLKLGADVDSADMVPQLNAIQGLMEKTGALGLTANEADEVRASAGEFILEGLHAHRRISRSEERGFAAEERKRPRAGPSPRSVPGSAAAPVQLSAGAKRAPMKWVRFSKYTGEDLGIDAEDLMRALADFFLESGFNTQYSGSRSGIATASKI